MYVETFLFFGVIALVFIGFFTAVAKATKRKA